MISPRIQSRSVPASRSVHRSVVLRCLLYTSLFRDPGIRFHLGQVRRRKVHPLPSYICSIVKTMTWPCSIHDSLYSILLASKYSVLFQFHRLPIPQSSSEIREQNWTSGNKAQLCKVSSDRRYFSVPKCLTWSPKCKRPCVANHRLLQNNLHACGYGQLRQGSKFFII